MRKFTLFLLLAFCLIGCGHKEVRYKTETTTEENNQENITGAQNNKENASNEENNNNSEEIQSDNVTEKSDKYEEIIETKGFKIRVDADVIYDETNPVNTYSAKVELFDGNKLKAVTDKLGGTLYYISEGKRPKYIVEKDIAYLEKVIKDYNEIIKEHGTIDNPGCYSEGEMDYVYSRIEEDSEALEACKREYETAPDDWIIANEFYEEEYVMKYQDEMYIISTVYDKRGFMFSPLEEERYYEEEDIPYDKCRRIDNSKTSNYREEPTDEEVLKNLPVAEEFIDKLELGEFKLVYNEIYDTYLYNKETDDKYMEESGLKYIFYRQLDGKVVDGNTHIRQIDVTSDEWKLIQDASIEEYKENYIQDSFEKIIICVEDSKIKSVYCDGITSIGERTSENVKLISLDNAKTIIKNELVNNPPSNNALNNPYMRDENGDGIYYEVVEDYGLLEFEYCRVRDKKNPGRYMIIPVFCLRENLDNLGNAECSVMVNAIDGSLVDAGFEQRYIKEQWSVQ